MTVAILMPVYNREELVRDAVASCLAQTFNDWVLLAYDDGSTDSTADVLEGLLYPRIRVTRGAHLGMTGAFNAAFDLFAESGCEYGCFLGSDDTMDPRRLALQVAHMRAHPEHGVCFTGLDYRRNMDRPGAPHAIDIAKYRAGRFATFQGNVHTGSAMFRADVPLGWHEEIVTGGADLLWVYECFCAGVRFGYIPDVLYHVRQHAGRTITKRRAMDQSIPQAEIAEVYMPLVEAIGRAR